MAFLKTYFTAFSFIGISTMLSVTVYFSDAAKKNKNGKHFHEYAVTSFLSFLVKGTLMFVFI